MARIRLLTYKNTENKLEALLKTKSTFPYFYKLSFSARLQLADKTSGKEQLIFFLGVSHTYNPTNPQLVKIEKYWKQFLKVTKSNKKLVLVEGGKRPIEENEELAVKKYGEGGYITLLASKNNIETFSPEPSDKKEIAKLIKRFSKEQIMYYYFARLAGQWNRSPLKSNFEVYMQERCLHRYKNITGWTDFDFSLQNFTKIHNKLHDHEFDKYDEECFNADSDPKYNPVVGASAKIRDLHIYSKIKYFLNQGYSLFIIYGSSHAFILEPALKSIFSHIRTKP